MATYPIKMLKDEENKPFVPLVSTSCIRDENSRTLQQLLDKKLSPNNLLAGDYVNITTEGNNCYVNVDLPANLNIINNLTTDSAGQGALDAYQGKVLKDSIPQVVNDLSSTSTINALSANQGYVLNNKFNNYLPLTGGTISGTITATNYIGKTNNMIWELGTEDKENTWVPVMVSGTLKHRVIPVTYNTINPTLNNLTITDSITTIRNDINASLSNNNVSGTKYITSYNILDTNRKIINRLEAIIEPTGLIGSYWYVRNYDNSGNQVNQSGIGMYMNKSGELTYSIGNAANFRKAIEVSKAGNYGFYKWPSGQLILSDSGTTTISKDIIITTYGRPVYLSVTGDNNPTTSTSWFSIYFYRDGTLISNQIVESHGSSWNIPFSMQYLDIVEAGTYTYTVSFVIGTGSTDLNESGNVQSPNFTVFEI